MYPNAISPSSRLTWRRLLVWPAVVLALGLSFAGAASAQSGFQATVTGIIPKPNPCPNGDIFCGTALTNYGAATWTSSPVNFAPYSATCDSYESTTTFVLGDGSTLVLDETGLACGPAASFSAPGGFKSYGNPFDVAGSWTVQAATGQFSSVNGEGTNTLRAAGAHVSGAYSGAS
jgi:hypothetical protein